MTVTRRGATWTAILCVLAGCGGSHESSIESETPAPGPRSYEEIDTRQFETGEFAATGPEIAGGRARTAGGLAMRNDAGSGPPIGTIHGDGGHTDAMPDAAMADADVRVDADADPPSDRIACTPGETRSCEPLSVSWCAYSGERQCVDGFFGPCVYRYPHDLCGNHLDDNGDGHADELDHCDLCRNAGPDVVDDGEWCEGTDDDCDGTIDDDCRERDDPTVTIVAISAEDMCSGASDPTGPGECLERMRCDENGYLRTDEGCGTYHCGTLLYGDGRRRSNYCTVLGTCVDGVPMATGHTW